MRNYTSPKTVHSKSEKAPNKDAYSTVVVLVVVVAQAWDCLLPLHCLCVVWGLRVLLFLSASWWVVAGAGVFARVCLSFRCMWSCDFTRVVILGSSLGLSIASPFPLGGLGPEGPPVS